VTKKKCQAAAPRNKKAKPAPLFDTDRFRRYIESAFRTLWEISQRGEPPRAFPVEPLPPGR
jgi:hypothetical protein